MVIQLVKDEKGIQKLLCDCVKNEPYQANETLTGVVIFLVEIDEEDVLTFMCPSCKGTLVSNMKTGEKHWFKQDNNYLVEINPDGTPLKKIGQIEKPKELPPCPVCQKKALILYDASDEPYDLQCSYCETKIISGKVFGGKNNGNRN